MSILLNRFVNHFNIDCTLEQLPLLQEILHHFEKIPYENLSKIITADRKLPFRSPETILDEYIESGLGGTCFSLTYMLHQLLTELKFDVALLLADRTYGENTHTLIKVKIGEESYLIDIGYLIFKPFHLPLGEELFSFRENCFAIERKEDRALLYTLFPNGHRKLRYSAKLHTAPEELYFDAWRESLNFDMMHKMIINCYHNGDRIYINNGTCHINGNAPKKLSMPELQLFLEQLGIDRVKTDEAVAILGLK